MQLVSLDSRKAAQFFWVLIGLLVVLVAFTGKQTDPAVAASGVLLAIMSIFPLYMWLMGWSHGLPVWPVFALSNGISAALPVLQDIDTLDPYTPTEIIAGSITMVGFLLLGTIFWLAMTGRAPTPPRKVLAISQAHAVRYLLLFILLGILFSSGLLRLPGNLMQVTRGVTMSLSLMAIFVLSFYHGRGVLDRRSLYLMVGGLVVTLAMNLTSLMLAQGFVSVAMAVLGYMLGSGKLPWRVLACVFVVVAVLHPGKYEMRSRYWGGEATGTLSMQTLPAFYGEWFASGLSEIGGFSGVTRVKREDERASSAFERGGNIHMLLMVQKKSPNEVPFFNGATYEPIPRLLIPRFLDSNKGISHAGNQMLSVNYGLIELEYVGSVSIGWGLITEAYANYGYFGVAGLAIFLAVYYSIMTRLTVGVPMTSLRFVLGLLALAAATAQDTMGIFITSQFQGMVGVSLASFFLMRRQLNPYSEDAEGAGELKDLVTKRSKCAEETGQNKQDTKRQRDEGANGERLAADGGVVRTMPAKMPQRMARWMPRRMKKQVLVARRAAVDSIPQEASGNGGGQSSTDEERTRAEAPKRPRQLAVPFQNYRRYRG